MLKADTKDYILMKILDPCNSPARMKNFQGISFSFALCICKQKLQVFK